ncbi:MAG TPA: amidohydrolase family protein [Acidimicrobiia bacterium]
MDRRAGGLLLSQRATDEFAPLPLRAEDERALEQLRADGRPQGLAGDRRDTAATLRAIDAAHGGGFYAVPPEAEDDVDAADAAFSSRNRTPVVDVQTHLVDARRFTGASAAALGGFLHMVDPDRWERTIDARLIDATAWATHVFAESETVIALLTSTPGPPPDGLLTNEQIAAAREVVDRYAGTSRVLTHTIVHPNIAGELDRMTGWASELRPSGWKVYTLYGPPTAASPTGGWFLDDPEIGIPFLERVRALSGEGARPVVAAHKGLGGPIPDASVAAASPRDIGPAAAQFPDISFVVYHSGYERNPHGAEGVFPNDLAARNDDTSLQGVDRLVASCAGVGIAGGGNVYAELGSTWFLVARRPDEAAHVLGKLLVALGPERIVWGTDSTWYGSPQPLIDAFRAFTIPDSYQERYGYPALTDAMKDAILSKNACNLYGLDDATVAAAAADARRTWVPDAVVELHRRIERP